MSAALQVEGLNRAFGALPVTRDVNLTLERGARHALIGPNGAGKTTLVNLITGALKPTFGPSAAQRRGHHQRRARRNARGAGWRAPSRSTSCFAGSRCWKISAWHQRARRPCQQYVARGRQQPGRSSTRRSIISTRCGWSTMRSSWCASCPMAVSGWWRSPLRSRRSRACCCSTSRRPACRLRRAISSSTWWPRSIPTSRC